MKSQRFFLYATPILDKDDYVQMVHWCYDKFDAHWNVSEVKSRRPLDSNKLNLLWRFNNQEDAVLFQLTWC